MIDDRYVRLVNTTSQVLTIVEGKFSFTSVDPIFPTQTFCRDKEFWTKYYLCEDQKLQNYHISGDILIYYDNDIITPAAANLIITAYQNQPDQDAFYGIKNNFTAESNPTVNDDQTIGYWPGSIWIVTASERVYFCIENDVGTAVWRNVSSGGAGAVNSVNGQTGDVVLDTDDINEDGAPTHLWFTNPRATSAMGVESDANPLNHDRYTDAEADARVVATGDTRYFQQGEFIDSSAGAADAGKPVKLDAAGVLDDTILALTRPTDAWWVAKNGNDTTGDGSINHPYLTISKAMTGVSTDGIILVAPGEYAESISFSQDNVSILGMGLTSKAQITQTNATIIDTNGHTGCRMSNMKVELTATVHHDAIYCDGSLCARFCHIKVAVSGNIIGDQPHAIHSSGCTFKMHFGTLEYANTATAAGVDIKSPIFVENAGTAEFDEVTANITGSGTSLALTVGSNATGGIFQIYKCTIDIEDADTTFLAGLGYLGGAGSHELFDNMIHVVATGNGYGIYAVVAGETIRSAYNHIHVTSVGGNAYGINRVTGTVISQYDDVVAANGNSGTITLIGSLTDGDFEVSGDSKAATMTLTNQINEFSTDGTLAGDSDDAVPTEKAVKTYVDTEIITDHNDLSNIQGGAADEYYHMTSAQHTALGARVLFQWNINGPLATGTTYDGIRVAHTNLTIESIRATIVDSGSGSSTLVDVNVGNAGGAPGTVFSAADQRPELANSSDWAVSSGGTLSSSSITAGQIITVDIDQIGTDSSTLTIQMKCKEA